MFFTFQIRVGVSLLSKYRKQILNYQLPERVIKRVRCEECNSIFTTRTKEKTICPTCLRFKKWDLAKCEKETRICLLCKKEYKIPKVNVNHKSRYCLDCENLRSTDPKMLVKRKQAQLRDRLRLQKNRFSHSQKQAIARNKEWNITEEQYNDIISKSCFYCGAENKSHVGLDRIDNTKGYTIDNVLSCCGRCNIIRGNILTVEEAKVAIEAIKAWRKNCKN